jgi:hypothetical protein
MMKQSEVASLLPSTLVFVQYLTLSTSFFFVATSSIGELGAFGDSDGLGVTGVFGGLGVFGVVGGPGITGHHGHHQKQSDFAPPFCFSTAKI